MRGHEIHRRALEAEARGAVGINPEGARHFLSQGQSGTLDVTVASLPVNTENLNPLRVYTTGAFFFMIGQSAIDGADEIA